MDENLPLQEVPSETEYYSTRSVDTRVIFGAIISIFGLFGTVFGAKPEWFGQNHSLVIGFLQLSTMLLGIALISLGGSISLASLWGKEEKSIIADFGLRLISTGFVIALFAGLTDIFGANVLQNSVKTPQFGPYEQTGIEIGLIIIIVGLLMLIPYRTLLKQAKKETA